MVNKVEATVFSIPLHVAGGYATHLTPPTRREPRGLYFTIREILFLENLAPRKFPSIRYYPHYFPYFLAFPVLFDRQF